MEMLDTVQEPEDDKEKKKSRLNTAVAIAVVVIASFMAVSKVKDDNVVQAMMQAQAKEIDAWNYYQAKSLKQHLSEFARDQVHLQLVAGHLPPTEFAHFREREAFYVREAERYKQEKGDLEKEARGYSKQYDDLNFHDDQFDLSDALLSLSLALLGITSLTQKRWLFWVAIGLSGFGLLMGLAGFAGLGIHPSALIRFLS
jgi:hypothetical protein